MQFAENYQKQVFFQTILLHAPRGSESITLQYLICFIFYDKNSHRSAGHSTNWRTIFPIETLKVLPHQLDPLADFLSLKEWYPDPFNNTIDPELKISTYPDRIGSGKKIRTRIERIPYFITTCAWILCPSSAWFTGGLSWLRVNNAETPSPFPSPPPPPLRICAGVQITLSLALHIVKPFRGHQKICILCMCIRVSLPRTKCCL